MIRNWFLLVTFFIGCGLAANIGCASDIGSPQNYLGISLPYPKENPQIQLDFKKYRRRLSSSKIHVILSTDEKGKVKEIDFPPDSAVWIEPVKKKLKKIRFQYTEGRRLGGRISVPVEVIYGKEFFVNGSIDLRLPIAPQENKTDSGYKIDRDLMYEFLKLNNVVLPEVKYVPPMKFRVNPSSKSGKYETVVARVQIDETGELIDVSFPISGMDKSTHSVLTALINSEFSPASINDTAIASDFLLIFRFFDNIVYPYSPTESADSSGNLTHAQEWFMTMRLNPDDIYIYPIPRNFPLGYRGSSSLTKNAFGSAAGQVYIDQDGKTRFTASRVSDKLKANISKIMSRFTWYPAVNAEGKFEWYRGKIKIKIDFEKKVVCNAEWLE
ncbi:MAG: hypothetical protein V3V99_10370 [candidate division Zixibacteria bacterium]